MTSLNVQTHKRAHGTGVCVWSGLQRIGIIGKNILLYTPSSFAYDPSPLLLLYESAAVAFSPRARAPGATTLLLRIFVGKLPLRPVVSKERKRKRGGMAASCALTTARWFCFVFFSRVGTWTRVLKGAKPELGEFHHHLPISNRTAR